MSRILRLASLISALFLVSISQAATGSLTEGLLVEADLRQGTQVIAGRVLIEAGRTDWTTIAESKTSKSKKAGGEGTLKLEARATLLEPDVVEVETRITGRNEQNGKMIVRLGERAEMTTSQMESTETSDKAGSKDVPATSVGLKVLRVRYAL